MGGEGAKWTSGRVGKRSRVRVAEGVWQVEGGGKREGENGARDERGGGRWRKGTGGGKICRESAKERVHGMQQIRQ
eukprot:6212165-Pleurochrysis_carterae.AAC.6